MKLLCLLFGIAFGAAEFVLTKAVTERALSGKAPVVLTVVKAGSYAAVLPAVFLLLERAAAIRFGVGAGAGLLAATLLYFAVKVIRERGEG